MSQPRTYEKNHKRVKQAINNQWNNLSSGSMIKMNKSPTTMENNSEILDSNSAAPAKNAIFPRNSWATIAITVMIPIIPCFIFFFRPSETNCIFLTIFSCFRLNRIENDKKYVFGNHFAFFYPVQIHRHPHNWSNRSQSRIWHGPRPRAIRHLAVVSKIELNAMQSNRLIFAKHFQISFDHGALQFHWVSNPHSFGMQ